MLQKERRLLLVSGDFKDNFGNPSGNSSSLALPYVDICINSSSTNFTHRMLLKYNIGCTSVSESKWEIDTCWYKYRNVLSCKTLVCRSVFENDEIYRRFCMKLCVVITSNGLFTLPDSESDSDSKPNGYIALCRSFQTAWSRIQIPILTANYRNGIGIRVRVPQCR